MANKRTVPLTDEQYDNIISAMEKGSWYFRPNRRVRTCLILEGNLGMRIEDILSLTPESFLAAGGRHYLNVTEKKTGKKRTFLIPEQVFAFIKSYMEDLSISAGMRLFNMTERNVQLYLKKVCDYLDYEGVGTHSFRKYAATAIYNYDHDLLLAQQFLQHASPETTRRYIGISSERMEEAIRSHVRVPR